MELVDSLHALARQNLSGVAFLAAYGVTWSVCAWIWRSTTERTAAYATLFQGLVAFPTALAISFAIGALGPERPVPDSLTQLSILIGTSQLLGLPLLVFLIVRQRYALVPYAFSVVCAMHFVLYSWLYQTLVYIGMAAAISVGCTAVMLATPEDRAWAGAARVSLLTGMLLLAAGALLVILHSI